jgi:PhoH-like ATPase
MASFIKLSVLKKTDQRAVYVLDTNVLLHDPSSLFRFEENIVLIPLFVLDEIDSKKKDPLIGYNAREISYKLEQFIRVK